jgi:hypothetical protein
MHGGRQWALQTFGTYGPHIRERIAAMVRAEHEASLDAQDASGHRSRSVYGEFWRGLLERFEEFAELPGGALVRPGEAPYRVPVINGVVLFPWRYARDEETELADTMFATSAARMAVRALRQPPLQAELDLDLPDPGLDEDDRRLLAAVGDLAGDPATSPCRLVLVAISSSVSGLFSARWEEARLGTGGFLQWAGTPESLLELAPARPVSASPAATFTEGAPPRRLPVDESEQTA